MLRPFFILMLIATQASAHASEGGFVLLLPTDAYAAAGVATVALTVVIVALMPMRASVAVFRVCRCLNMHRPRGRNLWSFLGFLILPVLLAVGLWGPHDPSRNLLPLVIWTVLWIFLPVIHAVFGDLWSALNPWAWPVGLVRQIGLRGSVRLPSGAASAIGLTSLLAFAAVLLAHPAPTDPEALAAMVACYWSLHFAGGLICGPRWLRRAEGFALLFRAYASLAPMRWSTGRICLGFPGWRIFRQPPPILGIAIFHLSLLAVGSFDGLNETFLWIGAIGLNPLEFAGRSYAVWPNLLGLVVAVPALAAVFAVSVRLGNLLAGATNPNAFRALAPAILPIALGYHLAHYIPSALIEVQYLVLALNDPLGSGANLLGLQGRHVTTGFFSQLASVRAIWLTQAGAVVLGHVLAILLGHALALRVYTNRRQATLSQLPLSAFMIAYTLFGLWLLAAPRGV